MTRRLCFLKEFVYINPNNGRVCKFERMKRYTLPEVYADWFLENRFAFEYGYMYELGNKQEFEA